MRQEKTLAAARAFDISEQRFLILLAALTGAMFLGGYWLASHFSVAPPVIFSTGVVLLLTAAFSGASLALIGYVAWLATQGEPRPLQCLAALPVWSPEFLTRRVLPAVLTFIFLGALGTYKSLIPYVHPFVWDGTLSNLDRFIFGTDPWRLTHAVIGSSETRLLDILYGLWFPIWTFALLYFSCFAGRTAQKRFITAFFAVWIVEGIIVATVLSSVGPCYLQMIHSPYASRYAGLFPLAAPWANAEQGLLAVAYRNGEVAPFMGISAMPSLHVGVAFLLVLASSGWWRVAASAFCITIWIGSVHLGWHYASDGLAAAILTFVCWRAATYFHCGPVHLRSSSASQPFVAQIRAALR